MSEKDSNGAEQAVLLPCPFCGGKATVCIGFAAFIDVEIPFHTARANFEHMQRRS